MLVRIQAAQQAQTANPANTRTTERAERPERPERPEQAERPEVASGQQGQELRDQIRETIRAAREAAMDARNAQREANQVRMQNGLPVVPPVPPIPGQVHTGMPADMIPPQAVDISIAFFVMCAVMIIGWPLARAFGRRLERRGPPAAVSPAVAEQLQRIEQSVEAMAIEVERISESQRYLTKLHSGRQGEPAALDSGNSR
ncbi:MAG TPA: hypothetical protein VF461_06490 [Gemmatimonadaceae bacterium]